VFQILGRSNFSRLLGTRQHNVSYTSMEINFSDDTRLDSEE
jgi:hypothetical protein